MYSVRDLHKGGVSPFGHPRINDRSHLPAAYRSVPRPSSPLGAKASTERPLFTQINHRPHAGPTRRAETQRTAPACPIGQQQHRDTHYSASPEPTATPRSRAAPPLRAARPSAASKATQHTKSSLNLKEHEKPLALKVPLKSTALFPEDDAAQAGTNQRLAQPPGNNPCSIRWLGDGRYRTDDPLLAKQALSH